MKLRKALRNYKLRRSRNTTFKANDYPGFQKLHSIGIAFEAGKSDEAILEYARQCRAKGKEVRLLGYVPQKRKQMEGIPSYPWICKSNVNWIGSPSGSEVKEFLQLHHGVYIDLIVRDEHPFDFITSAVTADFKIGYRSREHLDYNLMLRMDEKSALREVFSEINYYLNFINSKEEAR